MVEQRVEQRRRASSGFTLVEMLAALLILGVVLTAAAASLVAFTRQALADERRFQATALLMEAHEEFQAIPWDDTVTLPSELLGDVVPDPTNQLLGVRLDDPLHLGSNLAGLDEIDPVDVASPTVQFEGPDGNPADIVLGLPGLLSDGIMPAYERIYDRLDGREYDVYRIVTWVERPGIDPDAGPVEGIKRLTVIVRWEILGRGYEEAFVSERAPDVREAGSFGRPRLIQFNMAPNPATLSVCDVNGDYAVAPEGGIDVAVRLSAPVEAVRIALPTIASLPPLPSPTAPTTISTGDLVAVEFQLDEIIDGVYFSGSSLGEGLNFAVGLVTVAIEMQEEVGGDFLPLATRTLELRTPDGTNPDCSDLWVELVDDGPASPPPTIDDPDGEVDTDPVSIESIVIRSSGVVNPPVIHLYRAGNSSNVRLCRDLSVTTRVNDLIGGEVVQTVFLAGTTQRSRAMTADPALPPGTDPTGTHDFVYSDMSADSDQGFRANQDPTSFDVKVERGGAQLAFETGPVVTFVEVDKKQDCPS